MNKKIIKILIVFLLIVLINNISYGIKDDGLDKFAPGGGKVNIQMPDDNKSNGKAQPDDKSNKKTQSTSKTEGKKTQESDITGQFAPGGDATKIPQLNPSNPQQGGGGQSSSTTQSGSNPSQVSGNAETINPDDFNPNGNSAGDTLATGIVKIILGGVQGVGSIVSVLALVIIGIRYMLGSVEERAEYKKTMLPYLVGAILVFLSSNIVGALYDIFN